MMYELEILDQGTKKYWYYDVEKNTFYDENQKPLLTEYDQYHYTPYKPYYFSQTDTEYKCENPQLLEIILGLHCNFNCEYCSQRTVRDKIYSGSPNDVEHFIEMLKASGIVPQDIQLWGGEPLVYWKLIVKLVPELKKLYPKVYISFPTNGSLLTRDKIDFCKEYNISFWISHDGCNNTGRKYDGHKDILNDPVVVDAIEYAKKEIPNHFSFKATFTHGNTDARKIIRFFKNRFGEDTSVSTGNVVECHDAKNILAVQSSKLTDEDKRVLSDSIFDCLNRTDAYYKDNTLLGNLNRLQDSMVNKSSADTVTCTCGAPLGANGSLVIDMQGNIHVCHNFPSREGQNRNIANLKDHYKTGYTHAFNRLTDCRNCLVLHACKGGCPGLDNEEHRLACPNLFAMNYGVFKAAFARLFGKYLVSYRKVK